MSKPKILQITAALEEGGVERGTLEMAEYTMRRGALSLVASSGGRYVSDLEKTGAKHFSLPLKNRNPFSVMYCALKIARLVKMYEIDLLHARSRAPAWAALIASKLTKTPFITTFHGTHRIQNSLKKLYNSSMVSGQRVIAISNFIKQHVVDNYYVSPDVIDLAPRGFSTEIFNPEKITPKELCELRQHLEVESDDLLICLPGRLTRWKGQVEFLKCLAGIKEIPGWKAILIGGSGRKKSYEAEIKKLSEDLGLEGRVIFAGSQKNMPLYYAVSDIVVSASIEPEAFGRVSVEGQAMRKPVIATAHGGSLETVIDGETGWLIPVDDMGQLTGLLKRVISGEFDLQQMGEKAREWVLNNFTTDLTCEAEWAAYSKLL